jgi:hypothetical protein
VPVDPSRGRRGGGGHQVIAVRGDGDHGTGVVSDRRTSVRPMISPTSAERYGRSMNLRAAFFVATSMFGSAAFARFGFACEGGTSNDASDGAPSAATCAKNIVLVDDIEREDPSVTSCTTDSDCIVTVEGDVCGCVWITPRFVTKTVAARMSDRYATKTCNCPAGWAGCDGSGPYGGVAACINGKCGGCIEYGGPRTCVDAGADAPDQ